MYIYTKYTLLLQVVLKFIDIRILGK